MRMHGRTIKIMSVGGGNLWTSPIKIECFDFTKRISNSLLPSSVLKLLVNFEILFRWWTLGITPSDLTVIACLNNMSSYLIF